MIQNNTLTGYGNAGIHLQNNDGNVTMNASVFGNSVTSPNAQNFSGIFIDNGATATDTTTMNAVVGGAGGQHNTFDGVVIDVSLSNFNASTHFNLYRNGSGSGTATGVIQDNNVGSPTVDTSGGSGPITLVAAGLPPVPATPAACSVPALMAAGGERSIGSVCSATEIADMDPVAAEALARLFAARSAGQAPLAGVRLAASPLQPGQLGTMERNQLLINPNAAGWGWFVDPTPAQDEEFEAPSATGERIAKAGGPADGKMDLLTVLMHEMEHARGEADLDPFLHAGELMAAKMPIGVRRGPGSVFGTGSAAGRVR